MDDNIYYSGGWDERLLVHDARQIKPVNEIHGPLVVGEAIDSYDYYVLTGSHRTHDSL